MTSQTRAEAEAAFDRLSARGAEFLGTRYAVMGGAMTWVSERNLVAAISNAGGFGVLACGAMEPDRLREEIRATKARTDAPFGVNLITMHPMLNELINVCVEEAVGHVVLAGGLPPRSAIRQVKDGGAKLICFAPALIIARKLVRDGADALVIEGAEAGGHIGPVSTSVLAQEILPVIRDVPVFVAGGIGRGEAVLAFLEMGACGCQLGTRFVCAEESIAHPAFKAAFIKGEAREAQASVQVDPGFPVIPVRALQNKATARFLAFQQETIAEVRARKLDTKEAQLKIEHFWAGALRRAVIDGDVENGSLMAGQSVGMVREEQPVAAILADLREQAIGALSARLSRS
ncbi:MAG TPA: nitronate monooxygenase [Alphaproteobacteria bacterium]|nr:nitronate monooxygenase [Alphaproteobacteria bacterium]